MKHFHILTLFPRMFDGPLDESILARARESSKIAVTLHNLRDYTHDKHQTVDDRPFGGGPGMVLKPEPIFEAVEAIRPPGATVILLTPAGRLYTQRVAASLATEHDDLLLICGAYEGVDDRVRSIVDLEISLGDFVLTSGTIPALAIIDSVARLIPGVLGAAESSVEESFSENLLEYPQYTRPASFRGMDAPEILLSGDHGAIAKWRRERALERTQSVRPDLLRFAATPARTRETPQNF